MTPQFVVYTEDLPGLMPEQIQALSMMMKADYDSMHPSSRRSADILINAAGVGIAVALAAWLILLAWVFL